MKRLSDAAINIINDLHKERLDYTSEYLPLIDALNRLAEYEDTKISPAVIKELYVLAKLRVADVKDSAAMIGRLVILPCKIGDTVWDKNAEPFNVISIEWVSKKVIHLHCISPVTQIRCSFSIGKCSLGKIVFLTKEEAEQALKGEK